MGKKGVFGDEEEKGHKHINAQKSHLTSKAGQHV